MFRKRVIITLGAFLILLDGALLLCLRHLTKRTVELGELPSFNFSPTISPENKNLLPKPYFSYYGWQTPFTSIEDNGNSIVIKNNGFSGFMLTLPNRNPNSFIPITGDFALWFDLNFEDLPNGLKMGNPFVGIYLYNYGSADDVKNLNYKVISMRESRLVDQLEVYIGGRKGTQQEKETHFAHLKYLKDGKFGIEFRNVGKNNPETMVIKDRTSGKILVDKKLPFQFFSPGKKLSLSFEVGNGIKKMEIRHFKIRSL